MNRLKILTRTPRELGYSFPPEWHPHTGTWISWPRPEGVSFPDHYHKIPAQIAAIVREIAKREQVHINVPNSNYVRIVSEQLKSNACPLKNVFLHQIKTNESWCRDHGPAFVLKKSPSGKTRAAIVDWGFNAYGGKYPPYDADDAVPTKIAQELGLPVFYPVREDRKAGVLAHRSGPTKTATTSPSCPRASVPQCLPSVIIEGGSVDFNGAGAILTTEQCLLNKNRNPGLSKREIERYLLDYYGQSHVLWLGQGIVGDDTDGHVDDLARFINPRTIVVGVEQDPRDANYKNLRENLRRVRLLKDHLGRPFDIVQLPMPGTIEHAGHRLPATYVNFYFVNGALLVPTFGLRKYDKMAVDTLRRALPNHQVIGIDCVALIWGLGAIHCLTQQQPRF